MQWRVQCCSFRRCTRTQPAVCVSLLPAGWTLAVAAPRAFRVAGPAAPLRCYRSLPFLFTAAAAVILAVLQLHQSPNLRCAYVFAVVLFRVGARCRDITCFQDSWPCSACCAAATQLVGYLLLLLLLVLLCCCFITSHKPAMHFCFSRRLGASSCDVACFQGSRPCSACCAAATHRHGQPQL
jgi:hypothetical protein